MATNRILTPWVCETESNGVFFYIYTREMMMMVSVLDFWGIYVLFHEPFIVSSTSMHQVYV